MGQLYPFILKKLGNCSSMMSISGEATHTGKSLIQTSCMAMFTGAEQPVMSSLTDSVYFEMLSEGNIYGKKKQQER